ncbi:hypothetical protein TWF703_003240 [Orbilia oligospora]|uniref:Clp ATPase C-terminal domain-containing protein n=1 Tax=Orbilia oligospora TaxID=2813651 RepID=A0A7C8JF45_ORBOL|nr:hypothetical protein TWF703_003240 [Orbilia oligospora]
MKRRWDALSRRHSLLTLTQLHSPRTTRHLTTTTSSNSSILSSRLRPQSLSSPIITRINTQSSQCHHLRCAYSTSSDFSSGFTSTVTVNGPVQGPLGKAGVLGKGITPRSLKRYLDSYVISQSRAKRVVSAAVYNHYLRVQSIRRREDENAESLRSSLAGMEGHPVEDEYPGQQATAPYPQPIHVEPPMPSKENLESTVELQKSNCLIIGPSGTGKTLIAKTLARVLDVPFSISDCTAFTQAGYVGEDVDVCVQRLLASSSTKAMSHGRDVSGEGVQQALLKILEGTTLQITNSRPKQAPPHHSAGTPSGFPGGIPTSPFQNFGGFGSGASGGSPGGKGEVHTIDTSNILFILCGAFNGLNKNVLDRISKHSMGFNAPVRAQQTDANTIPPETAKELQKHFSTYFTPAGSDAGSKNRASVIKQRKINVLEFAEPRDLISFGFLPEFIGRVPVLAALDVFDEETLVRVLSEPRNSLLRQYEELFNMSGVELKFTSSALRQIARAALTMDTGARALRTVLERLLSDAMFEAPGSSIKHVLVNAAAAKFEQPPVYFARGQQGAFQAAFAAEENENNGLDIRSESEENHKIAAAGSA